jgi:hypothetical protein
MKRVRILPVASVTLALALGAAACGGDDDDEEEAATTEAGAETVTLTADDDVAADEYSFELSTTPTAETAGVSFENVGEVPHELIFARINEGFTTEEAIELEGERGSADLIGTSRGPIQPGTTQEVKVRGPLQPGEYAMLCNLRTEDGTPHWELGQLEEFEIE